MKGSVTKRGRGWRLKFDLHRGADGRRVTHYMTVHGSKRKAEEELTLQVAAVTAGTMVAPSKVTLGQYLLGYLDGRDDLQPTSRERYADVFTRQMAPIAHIRLQGLRPAHVKTWFDNLRRQGGKNGRPLSAVSVKLAHRALSAALQAAVRLEMIPRNVCAVARPPAAGVDEVLILGPEEITRLLTALKGSGLYAVVATAISTGCRRGELCGLRWMNVDFAKSCIKIEHSMEHTGSGIRLKRPKTKNSKRTITLSASAVTMLQDHRRAVLELRMRLGMGKFSPEDFVFSDHEGRPISPNNLSVRWRRATRPLGMDVRFHSLRHSHASALIAAGIDVITVSRRLGHGSAAFTLRTYGHLFDEKDGGAAAAVDSLLR